MQDLVSLKSRVMTIDENAALLGKCTAGRIATVDSKNTPNITPVNYVYEPISGRAYIHHSSKGGRLLTNLRNNNRVCFEIDEPGEIVNLETGRHICNGDQIYRSVICAGRISIADAEEKLKGLRLLGKKYFKDRQDVQSEEIDPGKMDRLVVLVIDIETMSGKCREIKQQDA